MKKLTQILDKILEVVLCILIVFMVFGCVWQIITRFIIQDPSDWTEEFVRYTLIWTTMLGVPYAYGKDKHISIGFVTATFTPKGLAMDKLFNDILILIISAVIMNTSIIPPGPHTRPRAENSLISPPPTASRLYVIFPRIAVRAINPKPMITP